MAAWKKHLYAWRGISALITDLAPLEEVAAAVGRAGEALRNETDAALQARAHALRTSVQHGSLSIDDALLPCFALTREIVVRVLGLRPYDVQVMAGVALHQGRLVEMKTGEGKTLAAVLPACLNALSGKGVHLLTFNDYLARRDAEWMGPVYRFWGLTVGVIQEHLDVPARQAAYTADVTYATAKEAGFDFLRMHLSRTLEEQVHRPFHYVIVDEADSLLIDEARVPLVIAGTRVGSSTSPYRVAEVVAGLDAEVDWETSESGRMVFLTEQGLNRIEAALACGDLHADENYRLLTEINQALHVRVLLHRDVDYLVRDGQIVLVDEFTGRVVEDRRWPDGLQSGLEAKEGLAIQPGGRMLGSITLPHFIKQYPRCCGMTATAQSAAEELDAFYGLKVAPLPPNQPCIREDLPDVIFTHKVAKHQALVEEITQVHQTSRPVLVGTGSVAASEALAEQLAAVGVPCRVLNAKQDEAEAEIIAEAGALGAVTISTNMAGRGTDIRLGGAGEMTRDQVVALGGLYVIGTTRHDSRRIDDQLRGRAGRQGDPGASRFFISLEDDLMVRFGLHELIPKKWRASQQDAPLDNPVIRREVDRLQRIVEGQHYEIRKTMAQYTVLVEAQRSLLHAWRHEVLMEETSLDVCAETHPTLHADWTRRFGTNAVQAAERAITLHHIDACWADHLELIAHIREGIHLVGIAGLRPLDEFQKQISEAYHEMQQTIAERTAATFATLEATDEGLNLADAGVQGPSATWTYLVSDRVQSDLQQMLFGPANAPFAAVGVLMTGPLLAVWGLWRRLRSGR